MTTVKTDYNTASNYSKNKYLNWVTAFLKRQKKSFHASIPMGKAKYGDAQNQRYYQNQ